MLARSSIPCWPWWKYKWLYFHHGVGNTGMEILVQLACPFNFTYILIFQSYIFTVFLYRLLSARRSTSTGYVIEKAT